jgi:hypothetical protein
MTVGRVAGLVTVTARVAAFSVTWAGNIRKLVREPASALGCALIGETVVRKAVCARRDSDHEASFGHSGEQRLDSFFSHREKANQVAGAHFGPKAFTAEPVQDLKDLVDGG